MCSTSPGHENASTQHHKDMEALQAQNQEELQLLNQKIDNTGPTQVRLNMIIYHMFLLYCYYLIITYSLADLDQYFGENQNNTLKILYI